jgi:hypothetical protein
MDDMVVTLAIFDDVIVSQKSLANVVSCVVRSKDSVAFFKA